MRIVLPRINGERYPHARACRREHASSRIPAVRGHDDLEWMMVRMRPLVRMPSRLYPCVDAKCGRRNGLLSKPYVLQRRRDF
jgi:hypothetical protein